MFVSFVDGAPDASHVKGAIALHCDWAESPPLIGLVDWPYRFSSALGWAVAACGDQHERGREDDQAAHKVLPLALWVRKALEAQRFPESGGTAKLKLRSLRHDNRSIRECL